MPDTSLNFNVIIRYRIYDGVALSQSGVCTSALTRGHNRADSRLGCVHDDIVRRKQEGCGLDEFSSFLLQRR